jgi:hypothetical protein
MSVHVLKRTAAPSAAPTEVGQHWIDTVTNRQWLSYGTASVADWIEVTDVGITQLTGDVTAGPGSGSQIATIANDAVTFAKMQDISTQHLIGRHTAGSGDPQQVGLDGGLEFQGANIRRSALTGDVTASAGSNTTTISNDSVTNTKLANMAAGTIKGNNTGSPADPIDLTTSQVKTMLDLSGTNTGDQTITLTGDVTGSGTSSFTASIDKTAITSRASVSAASGDELLIADASDTGNLKKVTVSSILSLSPPTSPAGSNTQIQYNNSGAFGAESGFEYNAATNRLKVEGIVDLSNNDSVDIVNRTLVDGLGNIIFDWESGTLKDSIGTTVFDLESGNIFNSSGFKILDLNANILYKDGLTSIDFAVEQIFNWSSATVSIDWGNQVLYSSFDPFIFLDWRNGYWVSNAGHVFDVYNGWLSGGSGGFIDLSTLTIQDNFGTTALSYGLRCLVDSGGQISVYWGTREALANDGLSVAFNWNTVGTVDFQSNMILAGVLGLGTPSPSYTLVVEGTGLATDGILVSTSAFGSIPNPGSVTSAILMNARGFNMCVDGATIGATYQPQLGIGLANNRSSPLLSLKTQATQGAILIEQGYFGIGTNVPRQSVDVAGSIVTSWSDANRIGCDFQTGSQYRMGMAFSTGSRALYLDALSADTSFVSVRTGTVASPTERARFNTTGLQVTGTISASTGTASLPSYYFTGDPDTGMYSLGANQIGFTVGGVARWAISSSGTLYTPSGAVIQAGRLNSNGVSGTAAAPIFSFGSGLDEDTGMFRVAADQLGFSTGGSVRLTISNTSATLADAVDIVVNTTTGTKIATSTAQKIGFWNATPIIQPTTAVAAATFVANAGTAVNDASTFDGYTIQQVVRALRNAGLLA